VKFTFVSRMEGRISRLLNSFGGVRNSMPPEAIECVRDYFCATDNEAVQDSDVDEPVASTADDTPVALASTEVVAASPATAFDKPLISISVNLQSTYDELWLKEEAAVEAFLHSGCGCQRQCHMKFTQGVLLSSRLDWAAMDYYDSDHVNHFHVMLMGCLNSAVCDSEQVGKQSKHKPTDRLHSHFQPNFRGIPVCQKTFLFAFNCSEKVFKTVNKQFVNCGLEPKVLGNVQATSKAASFDTTTVICVKTFIDNYAEQFGLVLPGRVHGPRY